MCFQVEYFVLKVTIHLLNNNTIYLFFSDNGTFFILSLSLSLSLHPKQHRGKETVISGNATSWRGKGALTISLGSLSHHDFCDPPNWVLFSFLTVGLVWVYDVIFFGWSPPTLGFQWVIILCKWFWCSGQWVCCGFVVGCCGLLIFDYFFKIYFSISKQTETQKIPISKQNPKYSINLNNLIVSSFS